MWDNRNKSPDWRLASTHFSKLLQTFSNSGSRYRCTHVFLCVVGGGGGGGSLHAHICSVHEAHVGNCQILRRVPSALLVFAEYQYHKSALANLRAAAHSVGGAEMSQRLVAVGKTKTIVDHVRR